MKNAKTVIIISGSENTNKAQYIQKVFLDLQKDAKKAEAIWFENSKLDYQKIRSTQITPDFVDKRAIDRIAEQMKEFLKDSSSSYLLIGWDGKVELSFLYSLLEQVLGKSSFQIQEILYLFRSSDSLEEIKESNEELVEDCDEFILEDPVPKKTYNHLKKVVKRMSAGAKLIHGDTEEWHSLNYNGWRFFVFFICLICIVPLYFLFPVIFGYGIFNTINNKFLAILLQTFPFLILGIIFSSLIEVFLPNDFFEKHFPKNVYLGIALSAAFGFFIPVCDCATVPLFKVLIKKGVPLPSAITFMMSTPILNPICILSTWYAFGGNISVVILRIVLGYLCSILIGLTFIKVKKEDILLNGCHGFAHCECEKEKEKPNKLLSVMISAKDEFFEVGKFLVIGSLVSVLFQQISTETGYHEYNTFLSIGFMMVTALLLSLCSSSDAVIAKSFAVQFPFASIMGFMVFGPMIDIKNIIMLRQGFKKNFLFRLVITSFVVCFLVIFITFKLGLYRGVV